MIVIHDTFRKYTKFNQSLLYLVFNAFFWVILQLFQSKHIIFSQNNKKT